jgi:L-ascorbate metabolism protein UlaG (beta-lactamase superfamily)
LKNNFNQDIKILSDAWLSWYSVADLMQKNPITNIDLDNFSPDAVFISHAHMDHLDPYSLKKIFNKKDKPLLLLPETLEYLKDIFEKNLSCEIKILKNKETFSFK